jgi:hypothetical protein
MVVRSVLVLGLCAQAAHGFVVTHGGVSGSSHRVRKPCCMGTDLADPAALCSALQKGESPDGLSAVVAKRSSANDFFQEYLTGDEWTCANGEEPPSPLVDVLASAPESVLEVVLMNIVQGAAAADDAKVERAISLVNALWEKNYVIPTSCRCLCDAVDSQLGAELKMAEEASGGNEETIRMMWSNLLSFLDFAPAQFERAKEALARCGPR